jgi:hypothetical protein
MTGRHISFGRLLAGEFGVPVDGRKMRRAAERQRRIDLKKIKYKELKGDNS